uniref:Uncharacterized protein n=1 Tax=viral metagenome TaxID=1070528 RepID=A0A6C0CPF3_9ZZZZ
MNWLEIVNYDIISLILSFLGGPLMFLNNSNLVDLIDFEYRYKMLKNQMYQTLNFWSFKPAYNIESLSRIAYRNTYQQVKGIIDYWKYRFKKDHPYASHSPLPDLDCTFITDTLSIPICNLLRGEHRKNKSYKKHYHIKK